MLKDKKILLAVCGSIAAYKAAFLVRLLVKEGAQVRVIMTKAATEFISPLTLATLSKNECVTDYINTTKTNWNNHVELALWADLILIAPCSAGTISRSTPTTDRRRRRSATRRARGGTGGRDGRPRGRSRRAPSSRRSPRARGRARSRSRRRSPSPSWSR